MNCKALNLPIAIGTGKKTITMIKIIQISALLIFSLLLGACKKIEPFKITEDITPRDFLSSEKYEKLIVEIVYVDGHMPTPEAVNHLLDMFNDRLSKPKGIQLVYSKIESPGFSYYTVADFREIEKENREYFPKKEVLSAYVFVCDGGYYGDSGNSKALGIAYDPTSIVIFEKTLRDFSGGIGQPSLTALEATALIHEFGHLFGLVNSGTSMTEHHQDVGHGHHCTDPNCIMYYAAETTDIIAFLTGGNIPEFDAKCIADMRANGGK